MISFNKFILYIFLILIYLGLSKAISPTGNKINYILNDESLNNIFKSSPISVILIDAHSTGFIIKTHYHKYRVVTGYTGFKEVIVRVSNSFRKKHIDNIGSSIYRKDRNGTPSFSSSIPGAIFIGDKTFGKWIKSKNNTKKWKFYRVYKHLVDILGWESFQPDYTTFQEVSVNINKKKSYFGAKNEFGTQGYITKKSFPRYFKRKSPFSFDVHSFFKGYFKLNFSQNKVSI
ncbi:MAG: hypothetical protein N4A33_07055 [Bacteriovoracaceae bacterium]|jgi:hypothetical protein|nr:hypothetical protein [Bacteriovoracaceae bacterium]